MASRARKDCLAERRRCECYVHCPHYIVLSDNFRKKQNMVTMYCTAISS